MFRQCLLNRMQSRAGGRLLRRFARRQDGSAAVEFGLVAAPFLALIFAILETALVFFSGQALETAVQDASRLIMTGQAQTQGMSQAGFKSAVCSRIFGLFDCQSGVYVDVKTFKPPQAVSMPPPVDQNGNLQTDFSFAPGGPGDIVVVRLFYQWPINVSLLNLTNMSGSKRLIVATAVFRNEPYAAGSAKP
jgi:Flp pilus assembly protein TadG